MPAGERAWFVALPRADRGIPRQVRLEVDEWFGVLTMVQRGLGITYGPQACLDEAVFGDVAVATSAGAPLWGLGIVSRDEVLRGAAGRAVLAAYRSQCRGPVGGHDGGPVEVQVARGAPDVDGPDPVPPTPDARIGRSADAGRRNAPAPWRPSQERSTACRRRRAGPSAHRSHSRRTRRR